MAAWPIFILSLKDADERRKPLIAQLEAFGLEFELFDAIDGRKGLPADLENQVDRLRTRKNMGRNLTDAEYACALSHLAIYREVIDRGFPGAIVLEDDAILDRRFPGFYRAGAYRNAGLVIFDYRPCRVWLWSTRRLTAGIRAARFAFCPCLTTGYGISARACSFMIENSYPVSRTADWPCDITRIGAVGTIPRLVDHPPDDQPGSTIQTARKATVEDRYWQPQTHQTGGFETRKWKRSIVKRLSRRVA